MISTTFTIFNATKTLPRQNGLSAWSATTNPWPQILILSVSCVSVLVCVWTFWSYCRGGHQKAEKTGIYHNILALGGFGLGMALWVTSAVSFQHQRNSSNNQDLWGWSCVQNGRSELFKESVDYALLCRLQVTVHKNPFLKVHLSNSFLTIIPGLDCHLHHYRDCC